MKAAVYSKAEAGKVLEIRDLDQPLPKDNEVVLRVRAASVNPLDWRMKTERPGVDVAGEIVAVGKDVTQFTLDVTYTRPDTSVIHRVPLTASVK